MLHLFWVRLKFHVNFAAFCDGKEFNKFIKNIKKKENSYIEAVLFSIGGWENIIYNIDIK